MQYHEISNLSTRVKIGFEADIENMQGREERKWLETQW